MWIIINQYRSICWPSTSIKRQSLGFNISIHLSILSCGISFHYSSMTSFKELRSVIIRSRYTFCSRSPQILKSTGFKSGQSGGQWWGSSNQSCFLSFNISRVSLAAWALISSCMNTHYVLPAYSFQELFSSITHYNNISHLPFYLVEQKKSMF